jgi:hypothetical protein
LKRLTFILILLAGRLCSQVGAPDLRCLEVLYPSGDVKLTWIPPNDSANKFSYYEIFTSINKTGPYSLISPTVAPITTFTFVHTAATASAQSRYYYMRSRFKNGTDTSANSDTLRSIFLNIFADVFDLKMLYNNIHSPALPGTSQTFTITKEFPPGTINNLAILKETNFAEAIDICTVQLSYQVGLKDQSGCTSLSNRISGTYYDKKPPDSTMVDSISVLENGHTIIAWKIPKDKDIVKYMVIEAISGINSYIDSVSGRQSTYYIDSSQKASQKPLRLYISAEDSCSGNGVGNFDETPTTMFLTHAYNKCAYATRLMWNSYRGMPGGIREYRIYYSVNGGVFKRVGATTDTTYLHEKVDPSQDICYFVRVVNYDESITASSNRTCFFSRQVIAPSFLYLQSADVLPDQTVQLRLFVDYSVAITGLDVLRSVDSTNFILAGFIPYNNRPQYQFVDTEAEPGAHSYYYRALFRDSCGNARASSNTARTMLLKIRDDERNLFTKHLSWNKYQGFEGDVSGYNIYRIINEIPASAPHAFTGPEVTDYTDNLESAAKQGARVDYRVQAIEGISNPYGILEESNSNVVPVYMEGNIFIPNAFAPAGANPTWRPVTHFIDKHEYKVRVFNRWGHLVFESSDDTAAWDGSGCIAGVYAYLVSYKNSRGEYREKQGTISLVR